MNFQDFVDGYYRQFVGAIENFDKTSLSPVLEVFDEVAKSGGTLWVAGNGGSAAISDHTVCDTTKGAFVEGMPPVRSISLTSNISMLTALANDIDYEDVFSQQLTYYLKPGDAVLLVSSSGNSPNVVKACEYANSMDISTIAFTGFGGGKLKELARYSVWIPVDNYGISEDIHQSLMHVITQYLRFRKEEELAMVENQ